MNKLEYIARSLSNGSKKVYETYVINAIYQKVNNVELEIETQKYIKTFNYEKRLIDLYLPQLRMAIEVDEGYHNSDVQIANDNQREQNIVKTAFRDSNGILIEFRRIKAFGVSLDAINKSIDELVIEIKEKIKKFRNFKWYYGEELVDLIKKRGKITTDDCFSTNAEIINLVYDRNIKSWMKGGYKDLWFPVLSDYDEKSNARTSRASWINYFNPSKDIIFEKSNDSNKQEWKMKYTEVDTINKATRVVFVLEKDSFGKRRKRFAGVFMADGWDDYEQAERWKKISSELEIPRKL